MFDPVAAFKKMHQGKCILGSSPYAPVECMFFSYSKLFLPSLIFIAPQRFEISARGVPPTIDKCLIEKIELRRLPGPPDEDGFYTYVNLTGI